MPETYEGKIQLAKLSQQLSDHEATQARDMGELKTTLTKIETKLDAKANADDVKDALEVIARKANRDDLKILDARVWGALVASGVAILAAILNYLLGK